MTEESAAEMQRRLSANSTAASIVLGLLLAEIEDLHPGAAARIEGRLDGVLAGMEAQGGFDKEVAKQAAQHARVLLGTRNT